MIEINKNELPEINEFIKVVSQDKNVNLDNFFRNLKILNIYETTEEELNSELGFNTADAAYEYVENELYITQKSNNIKSIYHELFHMASTIRKDNMVYNGYLSCDLNTETYIGRGLNEGYTELLSERYFNTATDYFYERCFVRLLEKILGKDILLKNYFTPNLDAIIEELSKYSTKEEIKKFIDYFDDYTLYTVCRKENGSQEYLQECIDECCKFLFYTFINKLNIEKPKNPEEQFIHFINTFEFGYIIHNKYGKISMGDSLRKLSKETGLFNIGYDNDQSKIR